MPVRRTKEFDEWFRELRDRIGRAQIGRRLDRLSMGNPGDIRSVGEGVSELKINSGPGYRVYLTQRGDTTILLLCGGDKDSQKRDLAKAKALALSWKER